MSGLALIVSWYFRKNARVFHSAPVQYTFDLRVVESFGGGGGGGGGGGEKKKGEEGIGSEGEKKDGEKERKEEEGGGGGEKKIRYDFDFSGFGDLSFFPGGLGYAIATWICYFWKGDVGHFFCIFFEFVGALGFLVNALAYYPVCVYNQER